MVLIQQKQDFSFFIFGGNLNLTHKDNDIYMLTAECEVLEVIPLPFQLLEVDGG